MNGFLEILGGILDLTSIKNRNSFLPIFKAETIFEKIYLCFEVLRFKYQNLFCYYHAFLFTTENAE